MSLRKKIDKQIKNMPKYSIQEEAFQNQALAKTQAFGEDRDIQMQQENIEQSGANAVAQAKDVTSSTSDLLGTISSIQSNKAGALRELAVQQAQIRRQKMQDLYGANQAMIDEKDKQWYQNVYAPYDASLRALQQRKANRDNLVSNIVGGVLNFGGDLMTAGLLKSGSSSK